MMQGGISASLQNEIKQIKTTDTLNGPQSTNYMEYADVYIQH